MASHPSTAQPRPPTPSTPRSVGLWALALLWLTAVAGGGIGLARYTARPGTAIHPGSVWPAADQLPRKAGLDTLVMALHPNCPCSRASIDELEVLMTRCHGRLNSIVLFAETPGLVEDSTAAGLWRSASQIPGVTCQRDPAGKLCACFGARTSGQVFLYDTAGALRFNGGITASRGHDGDSDGLIAITTIVAGENSTVKQTPVFGCSIR